MAVNVKFLVLFFLYFTQGLPYGIQTKLIPILLRSRSVSLSNVGLSRLLSFPWLFKVFIAGFLNQFSTLWLWLTGSFFGMALCCGFPGLLGTHISLVLLCGVLGLNAISAAQDIAVDAMAIRILDSSDLGKGNIAQVVGYKTGALVGGGLLVWMSAYTTWDALFIGLSLFYIVCTAYAYNMHNTTIQNRRTQPPTTGPNDIPTNSDGLLSNVLNSKDVGWIVLYVFIYKLGEQGMISMVPMFLLDNGFTASDVGIMTGIVTQSFSILGSTLGGWLASRWSSTNCELVKLLKWASIARLVSMATHCFNVSSAPSAIFVLTSECSLQLIGGIVTTATFTLMMQFSKDLQTGAQATHFSVLATAEVLGKLVMISLSGGLVELLGYVFYFVLCFVLSAAVVPVLAYYEYKHVHYD